MRWSELREKCRRESDYIITLFFTNEFSLLLTWILVRTEVTPNQITILALLSALLSGVCYSFGLWFGGSFFLFLSHLLDCTDGNLARAKSVFSPLGRWLDIIGDRLSEMFVLLGAMAYFVRWNEPEFWIVICVLDAVLLLLYYYVVDLGLALGITAERQDLTALRFKGVHVKWGIFEPVIYGFIILAPVGLIKIQICIVFIMVIGAMIFQTYKNLVARGR
jgi:phosphatidylglycerophosphate synthase